MNSPKQSFLQTPGVTFTSGWHTTVTVSEFNKQVYGEKLSAVRRLVGQTCAPTSSVQAVQGYLCNQGRDFARAALLTCRWVKENSAESAGLSTWRPSAAEGKAGNKGRQRAKDRG